MTIETTAPYTPGLFDALLKDDYLGPIQDQLNSATIGLAIIRRVTQATAGRVARIPIRVGRNEGQGNIAAGARLPTPGRQQFQPLQVAQAYDYMRIAFDGETVAASRNDAGAFARVLDTEITGATEDKAVEANRKVYMDGSGRLAQITVIGGGNTYTVNNPGGFANPGPGIQYLRIGMIVGLFNEITGQFKGSATIASVSPTAMTITLTSAIAGALVGDWFSRVSDDTAGVPGSLPTGSWGRFTEPVGLAGGIDDTDLPGEGGTLVPYQGLSVTQAPVWTSTVLDNGGVAIPLDLDILQQAEHAAEQAAQGQVSTFLTTYGLQRALLNLLQANRRYVNTMDLKAGFKALEYNGKAFIPDVACTFGRIYAIDKDTWAIYQHAPIHWVDDDGHILHRDMDRDLFFATMRWIWQIGCTSRARNVVIQDLQDPI